MMRSMLPQSQIKTNWRGQTNNRKIGASMTRILHLCIRRRTKPMRVLLSTVLLWILTNNLRLQIWRLALTKKGTHRHQKAKSKDERNLLLRNLGRPIVSAIPNRTESHLTSIFLAEALAAESSLWSAVGLTIHLKKWLVNLRMVVTNKNITVKLKLTCFNLTNRNNLKLA